MILAIDTSAGQCAVALSGANVQASRVTPMSRGHADALFPMIDEVLAECSVGYEDLTRIAVCVGPGSFTGLRAGIAAARGLALGRGIPAIGITRFEAIAATKDAPCTVRIPGRRETVFAQDFDASGNAASAPRIETGTAVEEMADPTRIAALARDRDASERPAPLYMRDADAALPKDGPPVILDA